MTIFTNTQGKRVRTMLVRKFVLTGEARTPLAAMWSLLTETAEEAELHRPVGWEHLLRKLFGRRALHSTVIALA